MECLISRNIKICVTLYGKYISERLNIACIESRFEFLILFAAKEFSEKNRCASRKTVRSRVVCEVHNIFLHPALYRREKRKKKKESLLSFHFLIFPQEIAFSA